MPFLFIESCCFNFFSGEYYLLHNIFQFVLGRLGLTLAIIMLVCCWLYGCLSCLATHVGAIEAYFSEDVLHVLLLQFKDHQTIMFLQIIDVILLV